MNARYLIGDVFERMADLEDGSVDLILTSPPFLALRSYLPNDHPDKAKEIGSEATPAEFVDVLLRLSAEWRRLLAPHGSICVELGDTFAGSGGAGGDYNENGLREGQQKFSGSAAKRAAHNVGDDYRPSRAGRSDGWPLAKSLALVPEAYRFALAYGFNPHSGEPSPAGQWRIRNVIRWVRPNPPVGALGDKFRPATSEMVVATIAGDRFFDLDAVREPPKSGQAGALIGVRSPSRQAWRVDDRVARERTETGSHPAGAPPLDWWKIAPTGYAGAHYAVWPAELCVKPIKAMCPERVCRVCGEPSRRISQAGSKETIGRVLREHREAAGLTLRQVSEWFPSGTGGVTGCAWNWENGANVPMADQWARLKSELLPDRESVNYADVSDYPSGWTQASDGRIYQRLPSRKDRIAPAEFTDCGHDDWRPGLVLDPFAGTGTTLLVATGHGRDAIGIDLDERNAELAVGRLGMMVDVVS